MPDNPALRNIWIVLRSEFLRRVRTKAFILTTLLVPFGFLALTGAGVAIAVLNDSPGVDRVAVIDETGVLTERLTLPDSAEVVPVAITPDSLRAAVRAEVFDAGLVLPASLLDGEGSAEYINRSGGGMLFRETLQSRITTAVQDARLDRLGTSDDVRQVFDNRVRLQSVKVTDEGTEDEGSIVAGTALGFVMAFLIYLAVLIYGQFVMQSVLEEKTNRVVEVMVSSVRPFHLLMGKVLGMGLVGLTQVLVWAALFVGIGAIAGPIVALLTQPAMPSAAEMSQATDIVGQLSTFLPDNLGWLMLAFLVFFAGGYLLYSSLFAAAGSAIEQMQDAQSFTLPLVLPLILAIFCLQPVMENPDSTLSVVLSLVPFFSPILMMVRMGATDVPFWQTALAMLLLFGAFLGAMWVSARIYRIGILSYGKKPSFRDLARWVRYS